MQPQLVGTNVMCQGCQHSFVAQVTQPVATPAQPAKVAVGCPHCGQQFQAGQQLIGTQVTCPGCQQPFVAQPPPVTIGCPHCRQQFRGGPQLIGTQVACPGCQQPFTAQETTAMPVQQPVAPAAPAADPLFGDMPFDDGSLGGQGFPTPAPTTAAAPTAYQRQTVGQPVKKDTRAQGEFLRGIGGLVGGGVLCLVGIVASIHNYNVAKSGEMFTYYSGAIMVGIISAGYGVIALVRSTQMKTGMVSKSGEAGIDRLGRSITGAHLMLLIPLAIIVMLVLVFMFG
ncbi:MAG: hypothetical protein QGF59_24485 [Pirellulaceae bacterium]|nr:hypothetical protein [Pirellulaceae bacterium]